MGKQWRNLGILVIVIIAVFAAYYFLVGGTSFWQVAPGQNYSPDEKIAFLALANTFTLSDINSMRFRTNDLLVADGSGKTSLVYAENKLNSFVTSINDLTGLLKPKIDSASYEKLSSVVGVYTAEVNTNIAFVNFLDEYSSIQKNAGSVSLADSISYCSFVEQNNVNLANKLSSVNDSLINFYNKDSAHAAKYDVVLVEFDFNSAFTSLNSLGARLVNDVDFCEAQGMIK